MELSRVFVKGLPPNINETTFRKHFDYAGHITDIKLIPHRRIGYVGYKSPDEATKAVKRLNRSFIRMSKITVEPAKPVADPSLSKAKPASNGVSVVSTPSNRNAAPAEAPSKNDKKRKREELDESDPKLQEFLGVMLPGSSTNKAHRDAVGAADEPPAKMAAVSFPENESDDEYEAIPTRRQHEASQESKKLRTTAKDPGVRNGEQQNSDSQNTQSQSRDTEAGDAELAEQPTPAPAPAPASTAATDDDWLRSRTNRLLDLVDDDSILPTDAPSQPVQVAPPVPDDEENDMADVIEDEAPPEPTEMEALPEAKSKDSKDETLNSVRKTSRLFIRNLPYSAKGEDVGKHFEQYGSLEEVHVPTGTEGNNKGFAFVSFTDADAAVKAFRSADGHPFQGRLLHALPAAAKRHQDLDEFAISKLPLKEQKLLKKKAKAATDRFNWNSLFMSQDAVVSSVAARLGVSKSELLDPHSSDAAVKQAIAETSVIQESKNFFAKHGVYFNALKSGPRDDAVILIKNFPYGTTAEEIRSLFEEHGRVLRVLMPPAGTIAITQFAEANEGKTAFTKLAYRRFKNSILFLEKGPKNLFVDDGRQPTVKTDTTVGVQKLSVSELLERDGTVADEGATFSLHVKNLSFKTTSAELAAAFRKLEGFKSAHVKTKTDPKKPGQVLNMGFGFVEFANKASAEAALKVMDGYVLHEHKLEVRASHRGRDAAEERRKEDNAKKAAGQQTKIIIKNLPFEATKKDVRTLFGTHGQLRAVRVPKKFNHTSKGYAFAEFTTPCEALNAMNALEGTHLLGRRLVLQFAEEEAIDPEEEIAKMQKKVGRQTNQVALQELTGRGRRKVTLGGDENEDGD
ncbi:hypothetical protein DL766_000651 [Monosporascus sp. MC13-8B]|uniref:Multiple RNA-binding domain-containing protein 1 n=1 Tax=Monosporascus cannonballus TaxID=155416 RepID=A0ABY0H260_9PEZI|nr:hypothetical protein DL762_006685 [Monosporascus cannonballus]RYP39011.1 hypothetical protein DL766_000651 [Monosporascus sp. MC13-8B]